MPTSALLLALGAAFVHALWNLLLARARDPQRRDRCGAPRRGGRLRDPGVGALRNVHRAPGRSSSAAARCSSSTSRCCSRRTGRRRCRSSIRSPAEARRCSCSSSASRCSATAPRSARSSASASSASGPARARARADASAAASRSGSSIAGVIATYTLVDKLGVTHAGALPYLELSMHRAVARLRGDRSHAAAAPAGRAQRPTIVAGIATFGAYCTRAARAPARLGGVGRGGARDERRRNRVSRLAIPAEPVGSGRFGGAALVAGGIALVSLG